MRNRVVSVFFSWEDPPWSSWDGAIDRSNGGRWGERFRWQPLRGEGEAGGLWGETWGWEEPLGASRGEKSEESVTPQLVERFWSHVPERGAGCWEWRTRTGGFTSIGYGSLTERVRRGPLGGRGRGISRRATHVAWFLHYGVWPPKGSVLCHHCDNPPCVRWDHLFLGDTRANSADAVRKFRVAHKLTLDQIHEVRRLWSAGIRKREIAERFGIHPLTVTRVSRSLQWKSLGLPALERPSPMGNPARGEESPHAKLTEEKVREMRRLYDKGAMGQKLLARKFGVNKTTAQDIVRRKSWTHVK